MGAERRVRLRDCNRNIEQRRKILPDVKRCRLRLMKIEIGVCFAAAAFASSVGVGDVGGAATPDAPASAPGAALSVL